MRLERQGPQLHRPAAREVSPEQAFPRVEPARRGPQVPETRSGRGARSPRAPLPFPVRFPGVDAGFPPPVAGEATPPGPRLPAAEAQTPTWAGSRRLHPPLGRAGRDGRGRGARGGGPSPGSGRTFFFPPAGAAFPRDRRWWGRPRRPPRALLWARDWRPRLRGASWRSAAPPWPGARGKGRGPRRPWSPLGQTHFPEAKSPSDVRYLPPRTSPKLRGPRATRMSPRGQRATTLKFRGKMTNEVSPADISALERPAKELLP